MKDFSELFAALDQTNKTNRKIEILSAYFRKVNDNDKLWTIALFTGRKPKRPVNSTMLKLWAIEYANISQWLFDESYHVVGDLAETIALLLPAPANESRLGLTEWINFIDSIRTLSDSEKKESILHSWNSLTSQERFVFNKILTGSFRVGVSQNLIVAALANLTNIEKSVISHKLMGNWSPHTVTFENLLHEKDIHQDASKPYPFFLAYPIEGEPDVLQNSLDWQVEWKWDGIRSQLIKRKGEVFLWTRGEELVTDKFPEIYEIGRKLPEGTVLDGEVLPYSEGAPLSFSVLQTRIGRKNLTSKILASAPVALIVYDIMEWEGSDIRTWPLSERRILIGKIVESVQSPDMILSEQVEFNTWEELKEIRLKSREKLAEGFMIKRRTSSYQVGRKRGDWWKWKIEPLTIDAVLIYAQKGHGRRADLYTDFTFAVWDNGILVPFAKAYSGLTDQEIRKVDYFVRRNTKEKFGPVRTVVPELVFEIGFEGIQNSKRHKCGIAVRFPRILRWRHDKKVSEADSLENLKKMLDTVNPAL